MIGIVRASRHAASLIAKATSDDDAYARAHLMGFLGVVPVLTATLLTASDVGVSLTHGQMLGQLLARVSTS